VRIVEGIAKMVKTLYNSNEESTLVSVHIDAYQQGMSFFVLPPVSCWELPKYRATLTGILIAQKREFHGQKRQAS